MTQPTPTYLFIIYEGYFFSHQALGESREAPSSPPPAGANSLVQPDIGRTAGRDFFSNITSDLNGIAAQTTSMFTDLFGG